MGCGEKEFIKKIFTQNGIEIPGILEELVAAREEQKPGDKYKRNCKQNGKKTPIKGVKMNSKGPCGYVQSKG